MASDNPTYPTSVIDGLEVICHNLREYAYQLDRVMGGSSFASGLRFHAEQIERDQRALASLNKHRSVAHNRD